MGSEKFNRNSTSLSCILKSSEFMIKTYVSLVGCIKSGKVGAIFKEIELLCKDSLL